MQRSYLELLPGAYVQLLFVLRPVDPVPSFFEEGITFRCGSSDSTVEIKKSSGTAEMNSTIEILRSRIVYVTTVQNQFFPGRSGITCWK